MAAEVWPRAAIYAAFGTVALSFVAATVYTQHRATEIQLSARIISENAAPSIEALSWARAELESLMLGVVSGRATDLEVEHGEARLVADVERYVQLPYRLSDETLVQSEIVDGVKTFTAALDALRKARAQKEPPGKAMDALEAAEKNALEAMGGGVSINASQAHAMAARIEAIREHSTLLAYLLSGLCVGMAIVSALIAGRAATKHSVLVEEYAKLQESRAEELEMFASRVAHDLISPLQPVTLGLHLLEPKVAGDPKAMELLRRARSGAGRAKALVEALLEFARGGAPPGEGQFTSAGAAVRELLEELQHLARSEHVELGTGMVPACKVCCAPGVLASVLQNLLRNSIKYMGDSQVRRVSLTVAFQGKLARFEVKDTGPGLDSQLAQRVFEPYVRMASSHQPGLGLGLATVKRLVESHRGRVGVRSESGEGSTFWFELPAEAGEPEDGLAAFNVRRTISKEMPIVGLS
jgi:signal transduction histidine kinase